MGQEALDVKLAQDRFLHCMIFETYEPSEQKIKSTPFAQVVFQHSFEVRSKRDKPLNFAWSISEYVCLAGILICFNVTSYLTITLPRYFTPIIPLGVASETIPEIGHQQEIFLDWMFRDLRNLLDCTWLIVMTPFNGVTNVYRLYSIAYIWLFSRVGRNRDCFYLWGP